jgi:hypothetical protein
MPNFISMHTSTYTWHLNQPNRDKTHSIVARILITFQRCHLQTKNMDICPQMAM